MKNITIPKSVTSIGYAAFEGCDLLKWIKIYGNLLLNQAALGTKGKTIYCYSTANNVVDFCKKAGYLQPWYMDKYGEK